MPLLSIRNLRLGPAAPGALFYFSCYAAQGAYIPFLSVFFARHDLLGSEIGLLGAVGPLMALLVAPGLLALADRLGWRVRLLTLCLAATALILLLMALPDSFAGFLVVMTLLSLAGSPILSISDGLVARMAVRRGLAFGKMRLWGSLSWAIASVIGGALWQEVGFFLMFPVASLLLLAAIPFARLLEEDRIVESHARPRLKVVIADVRIRVVLIATFLLGLAMSVTMVFAPVYLDKVGGGQFLVGLFFAVLAVTELPVMHWSDAILKRLGGPLTLILSYALFGSAYLGLSLITSPVLLLGVGVIHGLGFGLFLPTTVRLVADWGPPEWSSTSQGIMNAGLWGLAPLLAGPLGGIVYDSLGPAAVFLFCVGAALLAALVMVMAELGGVFKKRDQYAEAAEQTP
jgi:PPP family 3-phenylpropionic acid transporter